MTFVRFTSKALLTCNLCEEQKQPDDASGVLCSLEREQVVIRRFVCESCVTGLSAAQRGEMGL